MELKYPTYEFTRILGWSISRYEMFDQCKRRYFYHYYGRFVDDVPRYKIRMLKDLTSVPLEVGNVVHDVLEAFLRRLQKSPSNIDEERFLAYASRKAEEYFSTKTFIETTYRGWKTVEMDMVNSRIRQCLENFIASPVYNWIFMKAITNSENWMIEPEGYGETRLNDLKAYSKMDFLFPVDNEVVILDWKTGRRDTAKHSKQIIGYAAAAHNNFGIPSEVIYPKVVYLYPQFDELELRPTESDFAAFFQQVADQTGEMHSYCRDVEQNVPKSMENFPKSPSEGICASCNFQELCFPERAKKRVRESVDGGL